VLLVESLHLGFFDPYSRLDFFDALLLIMDFPVLPVKLAHELRMRKKCLPRSVLQLRLSKNRGDFVVVYF